MKNVRWLFAMTLCGVLAGSAAAQGLRYPVPPSTDLVEEHFGVKVPDPYRPLEELDSAATRDFVRAQDALTTRYIEALPGRAALRKRLTELYRFERYGTPFSAGGTLFYRRNTGLQNQSVLYRAKADGSGARVALDPNRLSRDGHLAVVGYVPSRDGRYLAYGVSVSGSDWTEWRIRDLQSGRDLPDRLRHTKYYEPVWSADGRSLYYSAFPAPASGAELAAEDLGDRLLRHDLGDATGPDAVVYERRDHADWQYAPSLSDDGRWLVVAIGEGEVGDKGVEDVVLIETATGRTTPLVSGFGAAFVYGGSDHDLLYFVTTDGAPNGRVIGVDPRAPERARWREIVPAGADALPVSERAVAVVGHRLLVKSLHDAHARVTVYDLEGRREREIGLPGFGDVDGLNGRAADGSAYFGYVDALTPHTVYRYDVDAGRATVVRAPRLPFRASDFVAEQVFYPAKDGTRIPMLIVHRKDLPRDGTSPTILYAYGGFGIPELPFFKADRMLWLERGGTWVLANIRGGGEYGEAWHRAATGAHRQVAFDDFISAGEWLIRERYTSTPRLAIEGASNGGLLMGVMLTQRPDLWGAVAAEVGVMDMLRFDRFGQGAGWTGDFGSPREARDFPALLAYSPLHNVRPGTRYPATLVVTGDHDTRVMPAHSFKFAAALQAAQAGEAPILLMIEKSSGHGGGPTVSQAIEQATDRYAFLWHALGVTP